LTHTDPFVGSPPGRPDTPAGGFWVRGIGGRADISSTGTVTTSGLGPQPFSLSGIDAKSRTEYAGVQLGGDIARLNLSGSGWNGHLGVTGGFLGADNSNLLGPGTLRFDVPFGGVYGVVTHPSGFFADILARWDWYSMRASNSLVGLS